MSKPIIAIVGPSGSGKSTSLRNLSPERTRILDLELKGFPFKNANKMQVVPCESLAKFDEAWKAALADEKIDTIVIESYTKHNELTLAMAAMVNSNDGFKTYAQLERMTGLFLNKLKNPKATVIVTAIDEIVKVPQVDGTETAVRRIATKGRAWEGKIEKEFLMVLFTQVVKEKDGAISYKFQTNTDGVTSAKTPMDLFTDKLIPNDISVVIDAAKKYYE